MQPSSLPANQVLFCCVNLICTVACVLPVGLAAPPSSPQASSRVWANYARQMEPPRQQIRVPEQQPSNFQVDQTSWFDVIGQEAVTADPLVTEDPGSCHSCLSGCCPQHQRTCQTWIQLDYLLGWRKGQRIPELVTTSDGTHPPGFAGALGLPSTSIVLGNEMLVDGARPGGRIDFGRWLANGETALAGRFYALSDASTSHFFDGTTHTILARPFFDVNLPGESAYPVNLPPTDIGSIQVSSSASLIGGDFYLRQSWCQIGSACVDLIAGYQFTQIDESLDIQTSVVPTGLQLVEISDQFSTRNVFHGGLLGLVSQAEGSCWSLTMLAKVGLGNTHEPVRVNGRTLITDNGGPPPFALASGLLAQPSNIGVHTDNEFTVIPELNVRYTQHLSECVDLAVGYTYVYWSRVVQPGDQIDMNIDLNGGPPPVLNMVSDDYWMQSLDIGITWWF